MKVFDFESLTVVDWKVGSWHDAYPMAVRAGQTLVSVVPMSPTKALAPASEIVGSTSNPPPDTRETIPHEVTETAFVRGARTIPSWGRKPKQETKP